MRTYSSITYRASSPSVIALGCFDGVHLGHLAVIGEAKRLAENYGIGCMVWTFAEPPKNYFLPKPVPLISTKTEKRKLIKKTGADTFLCVPFTKTTADISPRDFFEVIIKERLRARHIVCGFNYSFGKDGKGNVKLLRALCEESGIGLTVLPAVTSGELTVSSSEIRRALEEGDAERATRLLGRPYSLTTLVIGGQRLARRLGFPTLNQEFPYGLVIPKHGVYATRIFIDNRKKAYYGISNVGVRPTVGGHSLYTETHIFDYSGDLYGHTARVEFLKFIREERYFEGLDALTEQVNKDISFAKKYFKKSLS